MISNHYPMTYSGPYGWLVLAILGAAGVCVRLFFVRSHKGKILPVLLVAAAVLIIGVAIALAPRSPSNTVASSAPTVPFATVGPIIAQRCAVCHATHPTQEGFATAPQGVLLDTPERIAQSATRIQQQAVTTHAMPLGNITNMTDHEREIVGQWIAQGAHTQ
jgi:uncharacterized membrane protein